MLLQRDIRLWMRCFRLSWRAIGKYRFAALLANKSRIISQATNTLKTHPRIREYDHAFSIHAELACVLSADYTDGCTLYIARDSRNMASKPCSGCMKIIRAANIRYIVYHDGITLRKDRINGTSYS